MKALLCKQFGPIDDLTIEDLPIPVPGPGKVTIQIKAASLNFPDALTVQGLYQVKPQTPFVPGAEFAGIVHAVGIVLTIAAGSALLALAASRTAPGEYIAAAFYVTALLIGLSVSLAYNLWPATPAKSVLRRFDHAAIYLLIAATYTPFLMQIEDATTARAMAATVWAAALLGMGVKLFLPGRFDRLAIAYPQDFKMPEGGLNIRPRDDRFEQERRLHLHKRFAAVAFARANHIDRMVFSGGPAPKIGIISAGKSYLDLRQALDELGIDEVKANRLGLRLLKIAARVITSVRRVVFHLASG